MQLEKFCAVLALAPAGTGAGLGLFPPDELRFVLEFSAQPDLPNESSKLATLFHSTSFRLEQLDQGDALRRFAVLRFPSIERTLNNHDLFELAYQIRDALNIVSVEPDLGSDFYVDPELQPNRSREAALVSSLCTVSNDPPEDRMWSLRTLRVKEAWTKSKGAEILIGHPDTGIAAHRELDAGMFDMELGLDLIDGKSPPQDSLRSGMANPGHGTATSSVIASREDGNIDGVAPQARVVPIRCIEDVKVFNQAPVAKAIAHAHQVGCHIISMSLGGVPSRALFAAVEAAIAADVIVLAAAGNCVRTVVWPARYDEVIAVAASNVNDIPWKGSCRGPAVDITAPGEQVWCAKRSTPAEAINEIKAGQGTSYAVASVAGVAALWLGAHTREAVVAAARERGVSVQALFKVALQATARRPVNWDVDNFGPGIVNAHALTSLPLADIPYVIQRETVRDPSKSVRTMLADENGAPAPGPDFDWDRYGCELATIGLAQAREGASLAELTRESKGSKTRPSSQLAFAVDRAGVPSLRKFGLATGNTSSICRPLVSAPYPPAPETLRHAIAAPFGSGLETSAHGFDSVKTMAYLKSGGTREQLGRVEAILGGMTGINQATRSAVLDAAGEAIASTLEGKNLTSAAQFGLEALVALTGRPALRAQGGSINLEDPRAKEWHDRLYPQVYSGALEKVMASVGRIDSDGRHVGTGYVIAPGIILTNRHVLQEIAVPVPTRNGPAAWVLNSDDIAINFADAPGMTTIASKFRIKGVLSWGERYIEDSGLDLSRLDAALLEVETLNASNATLPDPLTLSGNEAAVGRTREIVTIGYPARPGILPRTSAGKVDDAVVNRLAELFDEYSVKYVSPGEILVAPSGNVGEENFWTLRHDATTLGGSSGSCVVALDPTLGVVGLHFGGTWLRENFAHSLVIVRRSWSAINGPGFTWK
jgi:serine protease